MTGKVNEEYDPARQPDLLPHGLDLRLFLHEPAHLDQGSLGHHRNVVTIARSFRRSLLLFLWPCLWRARGFDRRVSAAANHDAAEMQDSISLGHRRCGPG